MVNFFKKLFARSGAEPRSEVSVPTASIAPAGSGEVAGPSAGSVPPGLERGPDIPWQPGMEVQCLASATFYTKARVVCGEIWLLSADPELMAAYGTDASMPNVFSAQGFKAPLGVIIANGFGDGFFREEKDNLKALLAAIRNADAERLYRLNQEYVPFYCPECRANYGRREWDTNSVFDGVFFDYMEGDCPAGHRRMIED